MDIGTNVNSEKSAEVSGKTQICNQTRNSNVILDLTQACNTELFVALNFSFLSKIDKIFTLLCSIRNV